MPFIDHMEPIRRSSHMVFSLGGKSKANIRVWFYGTFQIFIHYLRKKGFKFGNEEDFYLSSDFLSNESTSFQLKESLPEIWMKMWIAPYKTLYILATQWNYSHSPDRFVITKWHCPIRKVNISVRCNIENSNRIAAYVSDTTARKNRMKCWIESIILKFQC